MALSIKDPETDRIVRELASLTGETMTEAMRRAAAERLDRERRKRGDTNENLVAELHAIAVHCASLPLLDDRSEDEILGWDENGLPT
jgi:antitoxin VapB